MKIAFPSNNQQTIASHIGLAKGFLIVDTDTNERFYIENPVIQKIQEKHINLKNTQEGHRSLGTGRIIPPLLAEAGVDILVSRDFGEGMIRNLEFEGIRAYETEKKDIEEILNQIDKENMREITRLDERNFGREYGKRTGYGRKFGCNRGKGFKRGMGYGFKRGFGADEKYGNGANGLRIRKGLGRGFGRKWED